jgi:hypothetical protein
MEKDLDFKRLMLAQSANKEQWISQDFIKVDQGEGEKEEEEEGASMSRITIELTELARGFREMRLFLLIIKKR